MFARRPLVLLALAFVSLVAVAAAHAAFPGPNGRIVFSSDRESSSTSEIYSAAPDGSDVKRLTWTPFDWKQNPTWSPDGTKIAYEAPVNGSFYVFVMNFDGSGQTRVSPNVASNFVDTDPTWSPDGTQLAFGSTRGGTWNIWVVNVDGSGLHRLNDHFGIEPTWSPDGAHIAYVDDDTIREMNADGSGDHVLSAATPNRYDANPDWSPDGSRLAFAQRNFDGNASAIVSIAADGSDQRQLTSGAYADYRPVWSPDGSKITFDRKDPVTGNRHLHVMNADGSGESQLMSSTRNDLNGSWGTSTVSPVVSPPDAPQIKIFSPEDGDIYVPGSGVLAIYFCTSQVSFVVSCEGNIGFAEPLDPTPGPHQLTVTATDVEGRQSVASVSYTTFGEPVFDQTAPTIALDTPADGATYALGQSVTVHYSCADEDGGSGLASCTGTVPDGVPLDTSRVGNFGFTVSAVDQAGNRATATASYHVVDRTPPTISIVTPGDHAVYTLGQLVRADYTCADQPGGSGLASCSGPIADSSAIDTSSVGDKTLTVDAADQAGNTAHASRSYSVVYDFTGFFTPVTAAYPATNSFRAGESIPFKFRLNGNQGLDVLAAGSPVWAPCGGGASTPAAGTLSYNASNDRYTYLATTDKKWSGTCRDLVLTLRDGTSHRARIAFG